jgi:hypothetical protein
MASLIDANDLIAPLRKAKGSGSDVITNILAPYLNSLEARFNVLDDLYRKVDTYITFLNDFLSPKTVGYSLAEGVIVRSLRGDVLSTGDLSSGEKHLILLLSSAILAGRLRTLFIIDEPEISLNVRWQRMLLNALLECTRDAPVQLLVASHSVAMANAYEGKVITLKGT